MPDTDGCDRVRLPDTVLDAVDAAISEFALLAPSEPVVLGFSGGKDSLTCAVALRDLGFQVVPLAVDMGYEPGWGARVSSSASRYGLKVRVIDVHDTQYQKDLARPAEAALRANLERLGAADHGPEAVFSPCTLCYNSKIIALAGAARAEGIITLALGHHRTDAIASLLKSALMYIDRWDRQHSTFVRSHFESLVVETASQLRAPGAAQSPFMRRLRDLVSVSCAGTDEPPQQTVQLPWEPNERWQLVRPLIGVVESALMRLQEEQALATEGSGCGHGLARENETPREMVHYRILRPLEQDASAADLLGEFVSLMRRGLTPTGELLVNVRNLRAQLLGPTYRGEAACRVKL